ncbi:hypothetical protein [Nocardia tenerifensis]|uniref:hypothetical protein n=1 Tax=Nocardia tenerifensis TaxID=228006 RepID=UPI0011B666B7|nr:hypothetical protein [Nocardia tenerifensis]
METWFAAAVEWSDTRRAEGEVPPGRLVATLEGALEKTGPEHGMRGGTTLCGISKERVCVMRHLWRPDGALACERCKAMLGETDTPGE